MNSLDFSKF